MSAPTSLQDLLDREAIRECLHRYCRGIDRADEEALRSAYWPDATDSHGAYKGSASGFIAQALPKLREEGGRYFHAICNMGIELRGEQASVESYFIALQVAASAPTRETFLAGRYLDRFERRGGEWRIAARTVVYDWQEEQERAQNAQPDAQFGARSPVGARWPGDAVYEFSRRAGTG
ncbi:nuclear transport factor 2 family protein [Ramlibacter sp.]|uniref:nuclear transport factor 2 family protein n=1 Tax=Ramlibacter sp. TaxID=1917967 RepID=UPI003D0EC5DF